MKPSRRVRITLKSISLQGAYQEALVLSTITYLNCCIIWTKETRISF